MVLVLVFGVKKSEVIPPVNPHSLPHARLPPSPQLNAGRRLTPAFLIYPPIHFDCARLCSFIVTAHGSSHVVCRCVHVGLSVKVRVCFMCLLHELRPFAFVRLFAFRMSVPFNSIRTFVSPVQATSRPPTKSHPVPIHPVPTTRPSSYLHTPPDKSRGGREYREIERYI